MKPAGRTPIEKPRPFLLEPIRFARNNPGRAESKEVELEVIDAKRIP